MSHVTNIPVPYFQINHDYKILARSKVADELFPLVAGFLELVDGDSMTKATKYLRIKSGTSQFELVMQTTTNPFSLFEVHLSWNMDHTCEIVCINKDDQSNQLFKQVDRLHSRLENTNYELLEKKNELEYAMQKINELSGPIISLTEKVALVPLFGELTDEKMHYIAEKILRIAHEKNQERLYFDFTGVGEVTQEGVDELQGLFKTLWYMGQIEAIIIGITPKQAVVLNHLDTQYPLKFVSTLKDAIKDLYQKV
ncbi:STAS domain-containing protein [Pseudalkalibacillus berkeleyi]|uniref:STAS domain-containing protein n=1 Tax=Pseudalkalibacillus berkeleyi TaxID=1069813 RepID=A0ABS9H6E4_9BACL|nr:hypothetical protein [Pseudalkalibacillus berkeleyi]MCF6139358.1 hypothetical protein [Pseudalkalibacillus berkeleyi]